MNDNSSKMEPTVIQNTVLNRFETTVEGHTAVLDYILQGKQFIIPHTEVPEEIGGRGIGSLLARAALDHARTQGLVVVPACPFIADYLRKHPEYQDLLKKG